MFYFNFLFSNYIFTAKDSTAIFVAVISPKIIPGILTSSSQIWEGLEGRLVLNLYRGKARPNF